MTDRHHVRPVCAGCGSAEIVTTDEIAGADTRYGLCAACGRLQEVETRAEPLRMMCDNCAYRRGSPERSDPYGWAEHWDRHIVDGLPFYCHKGLPLDFNPRGSTDVTATPEVLAEARVKPCAGWIAARLAACHRKEAAE